METVLEKTTKEDQEMARSSMAELRATPLDDKTCIACLNITLAAKDVVLRIPKPALEMLVDILDNMAEGKSVTLLSSDAEVSTQQAAEMLRVSRPHLVKLLEKGQIPFSKVGAHRRIALQDMLAYKTKLKENQTKQLDFLAKQAQDLNLGY